MAELRKLDSKRRLCFPERFSPGDAFLEEAVGDEFVSFRLLSACPVPLVEVSRVKGRTMVEAELDRDKVRSAMRAIRG